MARNPAVLGLGLKNHLSAMISVSHTYTSLGWAANIYLAPHFSIFLLFSLVICSSCKGTNGDATPRIME